MYFTILNYMLLMYFILYIICTLMYNYIFHLIIYIILYCIWASLVEHLVKNPPAMLETPVWFLGWEDPPEKGTATHPSILGLPWSTYSAGDLGSIPGLGRSPGEGNGYPLQYSGLENSTDCIVHGITKSRTWLRNFHICSYINCIYI